MLFGDDVKDQDVYMPVSGLRSHPEGIEAMFSWMTSNWETMYRRLPPSLSMLGSMVTIMTSGFTTQRQLSQVEAFFANKNKNGYDKSLEQSKDAIRSNVSWVGRDRDDVRAWLKADGHLG